MADGISLWEMTDCDGNLWHIDLETREWVPGPCIVPERIQQEADRVVVEDLLARLPKSERDNG